MEHIDYFLIIYACLFAFAVVYAVVISHKEAKKNKTKTRES